MALYKSCMKRRTNSPEPRELCLERGAQAVINGALVTALEPCRLEIGSGAHVLAGRSLWRERSADDLARELYLLLLEAGMTGDGMRLQQDALFDLLGRLVAQLRSHSAQVQISRCALAIRSGDIDLALASARHLRGPPDTRTRGRPGERRQPLVLGEHT